MPRKGHEKTARNRRMHVFADDSPPNGTPPLPAPVFLLYYQIMKRQSRPSGTVRYALLAAACFLVFFPSFVPPASADIYRWEDEGGVIHFTDDRSAIPAKYRGKAREIQKVPPASGKPSVSTMGPSAPSPVPSPSPRTSNGEAIAPPALPPDDDATLVEKLRAKIDAKERFLRDVDQKQSLAVNPYRNRIVSPQDLELYDKYKEELPGDRERLKDLESRLAPAREQ